MSESSQAPCVSGLVTELHVSGLLGATVSGGLLTVVYIWVVYGLLTTVSDHCVWVAKLAHSDCVCVTKSWPTVSGLLSQSTVSASHCVWVARPVHCACIPLCLGC